MGLTISYQLKARTDPAGARQLVAAMRAFAATQAFGRVGDIFEFDPPDDHHVFAGGDASTRWRKPGWRYLSRKRADGRKETVRVPPLHAMSFVTHPTGAETAEFGLASHPPVVVHREDIVSHPPGCTEHRAIIRGEFLPNGLPS